MTFEDFKKLIAFVESNNNQFAVRFEKHLYSKEKYNSKILAKIRDINECSTETAKVFYCCSFGKYQIMCFNLYSVCNIDTNVFVFCCDNKLQDRAFLNYLLSRYKKKFEYIYFDLAKSIAKELEYALELKKRTNTVSAFLELLKENEEKFKNTVKFIRVYNGSIFPSTHALDYFLRMLYHYEKKIKKRGE